MTPTRSSSLELVDSLPRSPLLDSGVLLRALGARSSELSAPYCQALWRGLLRSGSTILIAAPSVAELARYDAKTPEGNQVIVPRIRQVEVVSFTHEAALLLGLKVPESLIRHIQQVTGVPFDYIKYDALIAACAARHDADAFITMDGWSTMAARALGLRACLLSEMFSQPPLFAIGAAPVPTQKKPGKRDRKAARRQAVAAANAGLPEPAPPVRVLSLSPPDGA